MEQTSEMIHPERHEGSTKDVARSTGRVLHAEPGDGAYLFHCEGGVIGVRFLSASVFRLRVFRTGQPDWTSTPAVVSGFDGIHSSQLTPGAQECRLETDDVRLTVSLSDFAVTASSAAGQVIYRLTRVECHTDGRTTLVHAAEPTHHFYGLGEKTGFLDKQGETHTMWNSDVYAPHNPETEALYVSVPFTIHRNGQSVYGLFLDNPGKTVFDFRNSQNAYAITAYTGDADIYVLYGSSVKDTIRQFTELTGRLHLPPAWSIGYHQSRYSYMSTSEVLQLAAAFRQKQIPCDAVHLDIHYMNGYRVFTFDSTRFPDPSQLISQLREQGFHIVPIVDPGVKRDANYGVYQRGIEGDMFCRRLEGDLFFGDVWAGSSAFPDFTDDKVTTWWGEEHQQYTDVGVDGIWNDMNEPAVFNEMKTMEPDIIHRNNGRPMTHEQLHNLYGLLMTRATYEGMRKLLAGERPFVLTRAGYAGVGRYAAVWTGDNRSFWEHMEMAIPMVLNMGLSGMPFAGPDIGGFAHDASPELLARWTQMGSLFPFCRNHSALDTVRQEPWAFGSEIEAICRRYLELRYQWIPYIYTLFYEASQTGMPIIRPLVLEYPDDEVTVNLSDEFLLGQDILVAPVLRPGVEHRLVYLPKGAWFDYWTGECLHGPQHIIATAPLDTMPLYIRAGAILPSHLVQQHVDFTKVDVLKLTLYGLRDTVNSCLVYEDDGHTLAHEAGEYNLYEIQAVSQGSTATVRYKTNHAGSATHYRTRRFVFKHLENAARCHVKNIAQVAVETLACAMTAWAYDAGRDELVVQVESSQQGEIQLVWA